MSAEAPTAAKTAISTEPGTSPKLKRGLKFPGVLMQSVGLMAPTASLILTIQFIASYAGVAVPFAFLMAVAIMGGLALTLSDIAKRLPSAGGYYTFVRAAISSRAGLFIAVLLLMYGLAPSMNAVYLAKVVSTELSTNYSISIGWPVMFLVMVALVGWIAYRGVEFSGEMLVVLGAIELVILLALAAWGFVDHGPGPVSLKVFDPSGPSVSNMVFAITFSLFLFAGWEGSAPVAEESNDPRRNIPRAMVGSVLLTGAVLIIASWGILSGWGMNSIGSFVSSAQLPPLELAHHYWHGAGVILLIAILNSVIVISLAATMVITRVVYAFSRAGVAPAWLGRVHPTHRTPANATIALTVTSLIIGGLAGVVIGPSDAYFIYGLALTLLLVIVYIAGNIAACNYVRRLGERLNPITLVILPTLTTLALIYVFYKSVHPMPAYPVAWGIWFALAWAAAALVYALAVGKRAGDADIAALAESDES